MYLRGRRNLLPARLGGAGDRRHCVAPPAQLALPDQIDILGTFSIRSFPPPFYVTGLLPSGGVSFLKKNCVSTVISTSARFDCSRSKADEGTEFP